MANKEKKQKACDPCAVKRKTSIGGQALMEGIMMRGPKKTAMAVRDPKGEIAFEEWENKVGNRPKITKLPIIRGVFGFIDSMVTGYKSLMRSAELSGLEEAEAELAREKEAKKKEKAAKKAAKKAEKRGESPVTETETENTEAPIENVPEETPEMKAEDAKDEKKKSSPIVALVMVLSVVLAVAIAVVLFIWLPGFLFDLLAKAFPMLYVPDERPALSSLLKSAFEGLFKIVILVAYMALVSLMKDIRRTFMYHGAEHKTIFCYEHGKALTVANVRGERRFHPRCGTSFLILMVLVSIFVCFFIDPVSIWLTGAVLPQLLRTVVRLLLLPLVMGIGYEALKLAGRRENLFTRVISAPGMWLQRLTVLEPERSSRSSPRTRSRRSSQRSRRNLPRSPPRSPLRNLLRQSPKQRTTKKPKRDAFCKERRTPTRVRLFFALWILFVQKCVEKWSFLPKNRVPSRESLRKALDNTIPMWYNNLINGGENRRFSM